MLDEFRELTTRWQDRSLKQARPALLLGFLVGLFDHLFEERLFSWANHLIDEQSGDLVSVFAHVAAWIASYPPAAALTFAILLWAALMFHAYLDTRHHKKLTESLTESQILTESKRGSAQRPDADDRRSITLANYRRVVERIQSEWTAEKESARPDFDTGKRILERLRQALLDQACSETIT